MPALSSSVTRSGFSDRNFADLNEMLVAFWGAEKSVAWRRIFEDAGITKSAKNGISINRQICFWFDNARFALKPLRETPEGIVDVLLQAGIADQKWGDILAHRESGARIRTGQTFLFPRHDEMQWNLLRVAAICGAAGVTDDYYQFEDPDGRYIRGNDETVAARQRAFIAGRPKRQRKSLRYLGWPQKEKKSNVKGLDPIPVDK
ncbi:hypothetical protein B0T25DRAFT_592418 [Lasiosphaeria hispida]|uniref:Uncharacterized protein n=1 Tax=Lasiosphaeria hispida TaxID=260671 RepID=A0AAJ0MAF5_9PEZI|nr:hypothetical protein B0T25DRAFT_592418 [Lasiosphaeria hispida]